MDGTVWDVEVGGTESVPEESLVCDRLVELVGDVLLGSPGDEGPVGKADVESFVLVSVGEGTPVLSGVLDGAAVVPSVEEGPVKVYVVSVHSLEVEEVDEQP